MNDTPGWTPPGSSPSGRPSEEPEKPAPGTEEAADAAETDNTGKTRPEQGAQAGQQSDSGQLPSNWSAQQPPPAAGTEWGAPTTEQAGNRGSGPNVPTGWVSSGPGGQPGWGWNPGWQRPAAAKPGAIPLRPLGLGDILDGAVAIMRAHWRTVLSISLTVSVVIQLVATVATGLWLPGSGDLDALSRDPNPSPDQLADALPGTLGASAVTILVRLLGTVTATGLLTVVVSRAVLGRSVSIGEAWQDSRAQLFRLLGLMVLVTLMSTVAAGICLLPGIALLVAGETAGGAALLLVGMLGGLCAAVWILVRFSLATPALMLEKSGVFTAMQRSTKLVRKSWWRIFGIQALAYILLLLLGSIIEFPAAAIGMAVENGGSLLSGAAPTTGWAYLTIAGIGSVVSYTITLPISAGITALLYLDQRIRREALDLELARAAGVPGYQNQQPADAGPGS